MDNVSNDILKADKQQWTTNSRIEAEGLEWLYTDPNVQKNKEKGLEAYLLGESIPGARGELQKTDELDKTGPASTFDTTEVKQTYDDTVNKFREDPLFIIKKIELKQKQLIDKYSNLSENFTKYGDGRKGSGNTSGSSRELNEKSASRHRHRSPSPKYRRRDPPPRRRDLKRDYRRSHSPQRHRTRRSPSLSPPTTRKRGPERPKHDSLSYAFGVTDDILPPQAIIEAGKAKEMELKKERGACKRSEPEEVLLEQMQQEGSKHLRDKLTNIAKMEELERITDERNKTTKGNFVSDTKKQMLQTANMAELIKRKASKQYDPFNEEII